MAYLVVEDEYLILDFVCAEMADAGIHAVGATSADEALRVLQSDPTITALVTDINMPGSMDGLELASHVKKHWPGVRIVVTSGRRAPASWQLPQGAIFLPKPFYPRQLMDTIERMH